MLRKVCLRTGRQRHSSRARPSPPANTSRRPLRAVLLRKVSNKTPTKRCYGSHRIFWCNSNLVPRVLAYSLSFPRVGRRGPWERGWYNSSTTSSTTYLSTPCGNHTITQSHTFAALIRLSTTMHNLLTFNTREISSNNSKKTQPTGK